MSEKAPKYDEYQSSFREAFKAELHGLVDLLPTDGKVIDVPCGDGFYTGRLAERNRQVTAVDTCDEYLSEVRKMKAEVLKADAYKLPFPNASFDLVWCAQSLITLDPDRAIREMRRVVKKNGLVAILEVDEFHHILLPWPGELEASLPLAIHAASVRRYGDGVKLAPARLLRSVLKKAGFNSIRRWTYSFERVAPFDSLTKTYLYRHLEYLRTLAYPFLSASMKRAFTRMTDPDAIGSFFKLPDAELTCINVMYVAEIRPLSFGRIGKFARGSGAQDAAALEHDITNTSHARERDAGARAPINASGVGNRNQRHGNFR